MTELTQKRICKTNNWLDKNGFTIDEEEKFYKEQLEAVFFDPRFFLDNLETFQEYRVSWGSYTKKSITPLKKRERLINRSTPTTL